MYVDVATGALYWWAAGMVLLAILDSLPKTLFNWQIVDAWSFAANFFMFLLLLAESGLVQRKHDDALQEE